MNNELVVAMAAARKALAKSGASRATGDALALCYAKVTSMQYALTERLCFAALALETDEGKVKLLRRWNDHPLQAVGDALDALESFPRRRSAPEAPLEHGPIGQH